MRDIGEISTSLSEKMEKAAVLKAKLDSSLALQAFEPRAFEHGACKVGCVANIKYAAERGIWKLILGNGELIEKPLLAVPANLWPQSEWMAIGDRARKLAMSRFRQQQETK
jgi:hypothetical protein